ncbi:hypothetical protein J6590_044263 [Homalodisca vitripennis]|nr:hypothetical protein J6590_044263 [Homalodisca vitripennis]
MYICLFLFEQQHHQNKQNTIHQQEHKTDEMHTALMEASMDGHVEVAKLLLDSGAQVAFTSLVEFILIYSCAMDKLQAPFPQKHVIMQWTIKDDRPIVPDLSTIRAVHSKR